MKPWLIVCALMMVSMGMAQSSIVMNEIYSRGTNDNPDWVELFNISSQEVDVSGYLIYDNGGQSGSKPKKALPAGTVIPGQGFLVIVVDDTAASAFGLSSNGEQVWLEDNNGAIIDQVTFPALAVSQSYGRLPDGGEWQILDAITPGATNKDLVNTVIVMNEIYSRGTNDDPDWVELFNNSSQEVDVGGYLIYDNGGQSGSKPKRALPPGTIIPGEGFLVIVVDDTAASSFGLSSNGEVVWLENNSGQIIDQAIFPALDVNQSYGRFPDGGDWQVLNRITRGASNNVLSGSVVVMNEIYSRGTNYNPDWIELYNTSEEEVDVSGYLIYDNGGQSGSKPKKALPAGSLIAPEGFLVIVVDDTSDSGFGLSSNGEQVWLEDRDGYIIDQVIFPALQTNQSYGRIPDGGEWSILNWVTRGYNNWYDNIVEELPAFFPNQVILSQNYPNPFNPATTIGFHLPRPGQVTLSIYNTAGQLVTDWFDDYLAAGYHQITFDGSGLTSGLYVYTVRTAIGTQSKKMLLIR
jgi:hypothetical protein